MKLKYTLVFSIISFFITAAGFSQELTDQEIGFDVARNTIMLKEHGVKDQDLAREIVRMREMQLPQYVEMKKVKDGILQKIMAEQTAKMSTSRTSVILDIPQTEKDALKALYDSTGGVNWINTINGKGVWLVNDPNAVVTSWNEFMNTGWYGITVSNGHVTGLSLRGNKLNGILPSLNALTELITINFNDHSLKGNIDGFSELIKLTTLDIRSCGFSGNLQSLLKLVDLQYFDATSSKISGIFPADFYKLSRLRSISLYLNELEGDYSVLGQIPTLQFLDLTLNKFNTIGSIDYNNRSIPESFKNLVNLRVLGLMGHGLKKNIDIIGDYMVNLNNLDIGNNKIEGPLPLSFSKLTQLTDISFSSNSGITDFTALDNSKLLKTLNAQSCAITNIPEILSQYTNLWFINLAYNNINGLFPDIKNLTKLIHLSLNNNQLSGPIPDLTSLPLRTFNIDYNKFRFIDFIDQFQFQKNRMSYSNFTYSNQRKVGEVKNITKGIGLSVDLKMYTDDDKRYHVGDTYQWFKGYALIPGATNRIYTIPSLVSSDLGSYTCRAYHISNPDMYPLVLEREAIFLTVVPCTPKTGTLKASAESPAVNANTIFSLNTTATGLTYKWTFYNDSNGTIVKDGTQTTATASQSYSAAGSYLVRLEVTEANGCTTKFDKTLTVARDCTALDRSGIIFNATMYQKSVILVNSETTFGFYSFSSFFTPTLDKFIYQWDLIDSSNAVVFSGNSLDFPITPTIIGNYKVRLKLKEKENDCDFEYLIDITVGDICAVAGQDRRVDIQSTANYIYGEFADFIKINEPGEMYCSSINEEDTNFSYEWKLYDPNLVLISTSNQKRFPFTLTTGGFHKLVLAITDTANGCIIEGTRIIGCKIGNSCTELNPKSLVIKDLYFNLLQNLLSRSELGETDAQINSSEGSPQLLALKPYITNGIADKIYNFSSTRNENGELTKIDFSFAPNREYDVHLSFPYGNNYDRYNFGFYFNLNQYVTSDDYLVSCAFVNESKNANNNRVILKPENCTLESEVRYIDFCPTDCAPIEGIVKYTPQVLNANVNASFSLNTAVANLSYDWTFYAADNTTELAKATTAIAIQSYTAAGRYRVVLNVKDEKGCVTPFETFETVFPACIAITGVIKMGSGTVTPLPPTPTPAPPSPTVSLGGDRCRTNNCNDNSQCGVKIRLSVSNAPADAYVTMATTYSQSASVAVNRDADGFYLYYQESTAVGPTVNFTLYLKNSAGNVLYQTDLTLGHGSEYPQLQFCNY